MRLVVLCEGNDRFYLQLLWYISFRNQSTTQSLISVELGCKFREVRNMAKKLPSSDPDKLLRWLEQHIDDGKLERNGVMTPVISDRSVEFSGHVHEKDYNLALLYSAPWGFKKAGIGEHGIMALIRQYPISEILSLNNLPSYTADDPNSRLFRCRIPEGTLLILQRFCAEHSLNRSQLATLVLKSFCSDSAVLTLYQTWESSWGYPADTVRKAIYDFFRVDGTMKRYNLAKSGSPEAGAEKLS